MRIFSLLFIDFIVALALFVGIQACRGVFETFGSIFSTVTWLNMSAKDIWIFLFCLLISMSCISISTKSKD